MAVDDVGPLARIFERREALLTQLRKGKMTRKAWDALPAAAKREFIRTHLFGGPQ